jgi:hypothetical protein
MSWVCRAPTELEQVKSRTESCRSILKAKYSRPHRGKLDCKRHSIKLAANLGYMPTSSALPLGPGRRSVREYLDTLDEAAWGAASEAVPSSSPSRTRLHNGPALTQMGMPSLPTTDNYLIDLKAAIIVDVEATGAIRLAEVVRWSIGRSSQPLSSRPSRTPP